MKMRSVLWLGIAILFLYACSPARTVIQKSEATRLPPTPTATITPSPTIAVVEVFQPTQPSLQPFKTIPTPASPRTRYLLQADFNYQKYTLDVSETIIYFNSTDRQLTTLPIILDPNRVKNAFRMEKITWGDGSPILGYTLQKGTLMVPLRKPLQPENIVEIHMHYHLDIPYTAGTFGATNRQVNLANWYAFIPAYHSGADWLIHEPGRAGEPFAYDVADYDVTIRLVGSQQAVTLAAGVPAEVLGNEYHYYHEAARNFSWSASTDYVIVWSSANDIVVTGYVFPDHEQTGLLAASFVREAALLYNGLFGKIALSNISFIESDFPDGMEYDGLFFLDRVYFNPHLRSAKSGLATLSVHETAHQWWGGLVANDQATQPWLDEALCTFSELLFYENLYPTLVDWWWDYRINSFNPRGQVNGTIYQFRDFRAYVNAVYLRGARFMDAIRNRIGDAAFVTFLSEYARTYAYRLAFSDDFFRVFSHYSSTDLSDIQAEYFRP